MGAFLSADARISISIPTIRLEDKIFIYDTFYTYSSTPEFYEYSNLTKVCFTTQWYRDTWSIEAATGDATIFFP